MKQFQVLFYGLRDTQLTSTENKAFFIVQIQARGKLLHA